MRSSSLASAVPRQKWRPPHEGCVARLRVTSSRSGRCSASRPVGGDVHMTTSPLADLWREARVTRGVRRKWAKPEHAQRLLDGVGISDGPRSASASDRGSISARMPLQKSPWSSRCGGHQQEEAHHDLLLLQLLPLDLGVHEHARQVIGGCSRALGSGLAALDISGMSFSRTPRSPRVRVLFSVRARSDDPRQIASPLGEP